MTMTSGGDYSTRTFGNEEILPRVPLPDLESSCERFLTWCAPLLTPDQLEQTRAAVEEFLAPGSPARVLHAALERYDAEPGVHSWLDTFWPYRYLGRRDRIALNANFFFLFRNGGRRSNRSDGSEDPQVARAAQLVAAAVDFKLRLDDERIPPAFQRGTPLSMEQHKFLFSETRIPGTEQDTVRAPYSEQRPGPSRARHIVVFVGGRMVRVDVLAPDGRPYPPAEIDAALRAAKEAAAAAGPAESVGHLTTMARAEWAQRRTQLLALDPANADGLETVEEALLCLCLDTLAPRDDLQACDHLLHGDSANRWFDKSLSLIVFADGTAGLNVEHCGLDGTTMLSFVDDILSRSAQDLCGPFATGRAAVELVEFVLDDDLRAAVRAAAESFAQYAADTATTRVSFRDFGSDRAKKLGMSPDAFVQMAYQLAHLRAKGHLGATYESIATRQFRHGRTEAMRVVTPEIAEFVTAINKPDTDEAARRAAFRAAA
ncbi:MAG TPA: choline/carnitine O-acyltransferase, partial [Pseudonocardiaceae bacterium]|nr:choline/carnitine O-acyltransferase [Pseudonocardiaceae bacterium]